MKEALKLALEALELDSFYGTNKHEAITAIKEALAQPEQEPVAWFHLHNCEAYFTTEPSKDMVENYWTPLFTSPPHRKSADCLREMYELLQRCENEMRYAGWDKLEADNYVRNDVYEQVKSILEKNT